MMKWWWREGVERSASPNIERMLNVFDSHLSAPDEKAVSRICACKPRRNLQTFGRCFQFKQSYPKAFALLLLYAKQAEKSIQRANLLRKFVSEKLSIIDPLWRRRNPCNLWSHWHCCQKTTAYFVKVKKDWKRGGEKKENPWPLAYNAKV